jgi:EF hand
MVLDADKDGEISASEIEAAATILKSLDRDGDGRLTRAELGPPPPPPPFEEDDENEEPLPMPPPPPPVIHVLDSDHDGSITAEEMKDSAQALSTLDKDGDGTLSPRELHPHGPPPHGSPPFDEPPPEN